MPLNEKCPTGENPKGREILKGGEITKSGENPESRKNRRVPHPSPYLAREGSLLL
jgi:hypothetical protein